MRLQPTGCSRFTQKNIRRYRPHRKYLQKQQERAYGTNNRKKDYQRNQEADLYKRCGNAVLQILRETELEKKKTEWRNEESNKRVRIGHRISNLRIRRLGRYFEDNYRHYKNQAAYNAAQRQTQWNREQQIHEGRRTDS